MQRKVIFLSSLLIMVMIKNGHVTGRKVGGPMTDLGLYFLNSDLF